MLELNNISLSVDGAPHITDVNACFGGEGSGGGIHVLLGATLSGKTTLMRLIAGLEKPDSGSIHLNGRDITAVPVQRRNVAMVYQQFVNYPTLNVFDNIASPLVAAKKPAAEIDKRVRDTAALLQLTPFLQRRPDSLSGGQQQRVALARALVKESDIVLLDEPLANLDYKLREELREELPRLFAERDSVVLYATTDPAEALLLGDSTAALHEGRVAQAGASATLYRDPDTLTVASIFSDPPLNIAAASVRDGMAMLSAGADAAALTVRCPPPLSQLADGDYYFAFRAHHLKDTPPAGEAITFDGVVQIAEIAGSESFVHLRVGAHNWVMQTTTVQARAMGSALPCHLLPEDIMVFDQHKRRIGGAGSNGDR